MQPHSTTPCHARADRRYRGTRGSAIHPCLFVSHPLLHIAVMLLLPSHNPQSYGDSCAAACGISRVLPIRAANGKPALLHATNPNSCACPAEQTSHVWIIVRG